MALVEVDPVDDSLDGLVERGVVEDDVRGLAAKLERQALPGSRELALDRLADLSRAGERDLVDAVGFDDRRARATVTGDDVHDARWKLGLTQDVTEEQRAERRRLCGLQDNGVAGGERRRDLPGEHQQREVPRDDLARNSDRPRAPVRERVLELVGPPRVVEEMRGGKGHVDVARLPDRLASVQRFEDRELARAFLQDARDAEQVLRALGRGDLRPAVAEGVARGVDCARHLGDACLSHLRERFLGRGADRGVRLARLDPVTANVVAVPLFDSDDVPGFRSRCVGPVLGDGRALSRALEISQR